MKQQLFVLSPDLLSAMTQEEVQATWNDMVELGINRAPFDNFTIQLPYGHVFRNILMMAEAVTELECDPLTEDAAFRCVYDLKNLDPSTAAVNCQFHIQRPGKGKFDDYIEGLIRQPEMDKGGRRVLTIVAEHVARYYLSYLIVLLATRNVVREVSHNRLAKFGRGKQDYEYVTTLKIGQIVESDGTPTPSGMTVRPHLRRGHVRNQKYGPGFTYTKKVFIQPVFVNGYNPEDDKRRAYNVSLSR